MSMVNNSFDVLRTRDLHLFKNGVHNGKKFSRVALGGTKARKDPKLVSTIVTLLGDLEVLSKAKDGGLVLRVS